MSQNYSYPIRRITIITHHYDVREGLPKKNENRTYTSIVPHKSFHTRWEIGNVPKKKCARILNATWQVYPEFYIFIHLEKCCSLEFLETFERTFNASKSLEHLRYYIEGIMWLGPSVDFPPTNRVWSSQREVTIVTIENRFSHQMLFVFIFVFAAQQMKIARIPPCIWIFIHFRQNNECERNKLENQKRKQHEKFLFPEFQ